MLTRGNLKLYKMGLPLKMIPELHVSAKLQNNEVNVH